MAAELNAVEESAIPETDCKECWEFGSPDTDLENDGLRSDRLPCPPAEEFGDFSLR